MDGKNESEKLMEELKRIGEGFNKFIESIGEALNKLFYPKEEEWEMKCPYENNDDIYSLSNDGEVKKTYWSYFDCDRERFEQGNIFPAKEAAELEAKRRNLLTRFRAFRDECNDGWQPDWSSYDEKWEIDYTEEEVKALWTSFINSFSTFGYFKNKEDAERAIELFGNEIIELYVNSEV